MTVDHQGAERRRLRRLTALLLLASCFVALALAEAMVRLFVPVRDVGPLFTAIDPVMGKRIKKNFRTMRKTPEFSMSFSSNSSGFRGPELHSPPVTPILFLGDSFTMGYGVSDGEEYPALIKARLDARFGANVIGVVNTGMGDNGNGRWIKFLKSEADRFKPRLVVLQIMANDYEDNVREALFSVTDAGELNELPVRISKAKALEPWLDKVPGLSSSHLYGLLRQVVAALLSPANGAALPAGGEPTSRLTAKESLAYADRLTERLIVEALSNCQEKGYPVFAVLVGLQGERLGRLQAVFRTRQVPMLVAPSKVERPDLYYRIDGHWNPAGHAFVAGAMFDKLLAIGIAQAAGSVARAGGKPAAMARPSAGH